MKPWIHSLRGIHTEGVIDFTAAASSQQQRSGCLHHLCLLRLLKVLYVCLLGGSHYNIFHFNLQPVKDSHALEIYGAMKQDSTYSRSQ